MSTPSSADQASTRATDDQTPAVDEEQTVVEGRQDAVAMLHALDLSPPTLWDPTESTLASVQGKTSGPKHAACFDRELPWAGYDPLQVVDQGGYVWETVAKPSQAGTPGLVRRRRSGRPPQADKLVLRPRSLTRAQGENPASVARLDAVAS